jgi:hypothetical protein
MTAGPALLRIAPDPTIGLPTFRSAITVFDRQQDLWSLME